MYCPMTFHKNKEKCKLTTECAWWINDINDSQGYCALTSLAISYESSLKILEEFKKIMQMRGGNLI